MSIRFPWMNPVRVTKARRQTAVAPRVEQLEARELLAVMQLTTGTADHRWPSLNNQGDYVYSQQVGGIWQVFKNGSQVTSGLYNKQYPSISNDGTIVYFQEGGSGGVGWQVIRRSPVGDVGTIEFSSRNVLSGAHRDANRYSGIASNGTTISGYDFYSSSFSTPTRRFNVGGVGQLPFDFGGAFSSYDYPDINARGDVLYAGTGFFNSGQIYKTTTSGPFPGTSVAFATLGRINDNGDIVTVGGDLNSSGGIYIELGPDYSQSTFVGSGAWADINNNKDVIFESTDSKGFRQVYLFSNVKPDLAVTAPTWSTTQGVDFSYTISTADLAQPAQMGLYWSTDATFNLTGPNADTLALNTGLRPTVTARGTYPVSIAHDQLSTPPIGARYLLAVIDPTNAVAETDEPIGVFGPNNVKVVGLPDISFQESAWLSVENGGGVALSYFVKNADIPLGAQILLYWSVDSVLSADDRRAAIVTLDSAILTSRDDLTPKSIRVEHANFAPDANKPEIQEKFLLVDLNPQLSSTPIFDSDRTNDRGSLRIVPLVINVVTHGFNPKGILRFDSPNSINNLGWKDFWAEWDAYGELLEDVPTPGAILDGRVQSYVPHWESSEGFFGAFFSLLVAKLDDAAAQFYTSDAPNARVAKAFRAAATALRARIPDYQRVASSYAENEAVAIVNYLTDPNNGLLLPPGQANGLQHITLIGHSRGAAVNARVSQILSQRGYVVDQYTALDGFSTDWPDEGGSIGDIDIPRFATATEKQSYRVRNGLEKYVLDLLQQAADKLSPATPITDALLAASSVPILSLLPSAALVNAISTQDLKNLYGIIKIIQAPSYGQRYKNLVIAANDLRAPFRSGFDNPIIETYEGKATDHTTITKAYFSDPRYYGTGYLWANRGKRGR